MMNYSIEDYLVRQYRAVTPKFDVGKMLDSTITECDWRSGLTDALISRMKYTAPSGDFHVRTSESIPRDGFTRTKIYYQSEPGLDTPAYVLTPKNPNGAGVLAICGHGYGVRDIVGLNYDCTERTGDPGYHKDFAISLVKRGFTVIAPEPLAFGEMRLNEDLEGNDPGHASCERVAMDLLVVDKTLTGVRVAQCAAALSILSELPNVDAQRLGVMGISGGGLLTSHLSAVDMRVKACVVSGYACTFRACIYDLHHCPDNFLPGILSDCEEPDLLSLIAPRPMLWEAGDIDPIFPIAGVRQAEDTVKKVYLYYDAPHNFTVDVFSGDHQISGALAYDFLANVL